KLEATSAPGYYVWFDDGRWSVRLVAGNRPHRFQGSLAGVRGGVVALVPTRPELKDRIAVVGDAVQFDVHAAAGGSPDGFAVRLAGSCARFDLLIDGRYHAEQVRLGPRASATHKVPFDRCP